MLLAGAHLRLGQLLMDVGLVSQEDITEAVRVAAQCRLPIGRALVMNGSLSEQLLQGALQAQSLFRDGLITRQETLEALESMKSQGLAFDQAVALLRKSAAIELPDDDLLENTGTEDSSAAKPARKQRNTPQSTRLSRALNKGKPRNRLGELLVAAGILSAEEVELQLERSVNSGLPLGRYLVSMSLVSEGLVMTALNIQMLIRSWKMTREQGIQALKAARIRQDAPGQATIELPAGIHMHLGELLVMAEILSPSDMMHAVEVSLVNEEKLGQVLLRFELVHDEILQEALMLQQMMIVGRIDAEQAVRALTLVFKQGISGSEAINVVTNSEMAAPRPISFETLLRLTGVMTRQELDAAVAESEVQQIEGEQNQLARCLINRGTLKESFVRDCQRIHSLIVNGCVTVERAIVILKRCFETGKNVRLTLEEFNWTLTPPLGPAQQP